MKLSTVANKVIALGEKIRDYWERELPRRHPDYPIVNPGEDSGPPPPEEKKLRKYLESLPEDVVYKLLLLMYLGQGIVHTDRLADHYQALRDEIGTPGEAVALVEKGAVTEAISRGLEELKRNNIDPDALTFASARSRP